jgi:hypothetical protein
MHRWLAALFGVVAAGCAHYGFGTEARGEDNSTDESPQVAVWTVQTPAHWSLDGSRLTRQLVDALRTQGTPASWRRDDAQADTHRATLRCRLHMPPFEAMDRWASVDATVRCQLSRPDAGIRTVEGRGSASLATTGPSIPGALDISAETAAQRAVDIVALRVTRNLNPPSRESRH